MPPPSCREGFSHLYVMDECWSVYPIVLYFPKSNGGLQRTFSSQIARLRESGLIDRWLSQEVGRARQRASPAAVAEGGVLELRAHLKGVFALLLIFLAACGAVFASEMSGARWCKRYEDSTMH